MRILEKVYEPLLRYGNPNMPFSGTLKNKLQFAHMLTSNMKNMVLYFWSRFPLSEKFAKFAQIWQAWKQKWLFFVFLRNLTKIDNSLKNFMLSTTGTKLIFLYTKVIFIWSVSQSRTFAFAFASLCGLSCLYVCVPVHWFVCHMCE